MYWYNFKKNIFVSFCVLSSSKDNEILWKIENYNIENIDNYNKFEISNSWITEFYYFNTDIITAIDIFERYNEKYSWYILVIKKMYLIYLKFNTNFKYIVYSVDFLNKDYTIYFKFKSINHLLWFINVYNKKLYLNILILLKKTYFFNKYYNYFYFKYKFNSVWKITYSLVIWFYDFSLYYDINSFISKINSFTINNDILKKFNILYSKYKYIEISFNIESTEIENFYFWEDSNN